MNDNAYLRHPTLHGDTVVFVSDDDLWRVGTGGGVALRLTAGLSEPSTPCLSPDGRWIAYIGRDEQNPEVTLMPASGGPARRLTWLGPDTQVRGWTPQGHILFASTWGQPFFRNHQAYTIAPEGGTPRALNLGQVNHLSFGPGGAMVIGRNTADPARWKRYRGGTAGHLWIDADGSGQFRRMSELQGNLSCPMWIGARVYFLSDAEGVGNLYSCRPDGGDLRRHTDHADYYARNAQSDGQRIVYQCGARLWLLDPASGAHHALQIEVPSARTQAARRFVPAEANLGAVQLHPAGHSLALDVRGKLCTMPLWEGAVRQHGVADGVRYRHGQWLADGKTLVVVSDASGEECLELHGADGVRVLDWPNGPVDSLSAAPVGTRVAIANHRNQLLIGDTASGECRIVDHSDAGRCEDLAWSADGSWLAYSHQATARQRGIKLCEVASGRCHEVTRPEFRDYSPSFDPQGRWLYFLSLRTYDPVYDSVQFEMSFPRAARPYLVALRAGGPAPFEPAPKGLKEEDKDDDKAPATPAPLQVDLDGIAQRIVAFPVAESRFGKLAGAAQGKVLWTVLPIEGQQGRGGHKEGSGRLEVFDFESQRADTLMDRCDDFQLAADHATVLLRDGKRLRAIAVDHREDRREGADEGDAPSRKSGWIDLGRVRVSVDPRLEWRQMLREVWRLQRDHFWVADMSGVDWPAMLQRYEPLLPRVATRAELSDLIWELQGELGTSHAYESDGDHRRPPAVALGHLAADLRLVEADGSYEITRIVRGDSWDAQADSPLHAVGAEARVGERIVAVNGQPVSREVPPQALLVNQAGCKVELTLASGDGAAATRREVLVSTLPDEVPARYREWVERNRAWVHAQSQGRVGYLHLPDMMADGFAEFHRYFGAECDRDALIVDLRYNRGGHVSELLLEKVARKRIAYNVPRWGRTVPYPEESAAGPVVALCNEHAGSDGDIFAHGFKLMGIGPLVGTRTWGGVIGIWPRQLLVDGTETTQPEYSFWFRDVGWGVENHGTDPNIEVDNAPQDAAAGRDRQLETALSTALELAAGRKPALPQMQLRPNLAPPPLPPRPEG
ncbi:MAG: PDZ domain-containing protein [Rubrivivax sp.]|nr:PDZ domain-containing protein [Rubrivivax sp.]